MPNSSVMRVFMVQVSFYFRWQQARFFCFAAYL